MKTWQWVAIISTTLVICSVLSVILWTWQPTGQTAAIYSDGQLFCYIDLNSPNDWHDVTVTYGNGENTIHMDADGVSVSAASCPDQLCVKQGTLCNIPIVCLPNRLVIKWIHNTPYDAIAGN